MGTLTRIQSGYSIVVYTVIGLNNNNKVMRTNAGTLIWVQ